MAQVTPISAETSTKESQWLILGIAAIAVYGITRLMSPVDKITDTAADTIGGAGQTFNDVVGGAGQTFNNVVGGAGHTFNQVISGRIWRD